MKYYAHKIGEKESVGMTKCEVLKDVVGGGINGEIKGHVLCALSKLW